MSEINSEDSILLVTINDLLGSFPILKSRNLSSDMSVGGLDDIVVEENSGRTNKNGERVQKRMAAPSVKVCDK
jgi:hypothetical protein